LKLLNEAGGNQNETNLEKGNNEFLWVGQGYDTNTHITGDGTCNMISPVNPTDPPPVLNAGNEYNAGNED